MELRHLAAFVAVAEELSFHRAAARLNISQPPLSQQIRRLEREVGVSLLHRTTRRVELTAAGAAFLEEARRALAAAQAATRAAHHAAAGQTGVVRLGFSGPTSYEVLLALVRRFRQERPRVRLDIVGPLYGGELADRLRRQEADAGLLRLPVSRRGLRIRELLRHPVVAALPVEHRLAGRAGIQLIDLRDDLLVSYPSGRGSVVNTVLREACLHRGFTLEVVQEAPDTHTILSLVGAGVGIGLVPSSATHLAVPGVVFVPVSDAPELPLGLAWREDDRNPALTALIGLLAEITPAGAVSAPGPSG